MGAATPNRVKRSRRCSGSSIASRTRATTFAIPANMVAVLLTWSTLALCAGWMDGSVGLGLGTLAVLRACQSLAMPLEDAWIDRAEERRAMPFSEADWIVRWAGGTPKE